MRSFTLVAVYALCHLACVSLALPAAPQARETSSFTTVPLSKHITLSPPRSRFLSTHNGSSIPAGGAVWPTAIYWSTVQIGTPPKDFPVAIDSGSGDLDISGKGCVGCVHTAPNNAYDPKASSSSKRVFP